MRPPALPLHRPAAAVAITAVLLTPYAPAPPPMDGLVESAVQRLLLAGQVAAAKFGGGGPITDPAREREVLDSVAAMSAAAGLAPETGVRFFRAQIEAAKVVQRGLHARWRAHPALRPRERPDLATEVRPRLDALTPRMLRLLKQTEPVRRSAPECHARLAQARHAAEARTPLDGLHRMALNQALRPVCDLP
ncbi:chorismate mutase [Thermocatellispora tengchongensis]|uniref:chorismate mutase n=1 Tax=Thermocatellispora tengchongensis TaxID=1073253 RepID=A0A840PBY4_9ACTN|nr:chorismate mutase [Thermocatellispora tengchongensis]MBB5134940.1 chorismate mutase [Thermocatellispora tengchongensis]